MKALKQFSFAALVLATGIASAATQPFTATTAAITLDLVAITANLNGYTLASTGGAALNSTTGVLTANVQGVSTATNPGAIAIDFNDAQGFNFTKLGNLPISLTNFSFDVGTKDLTGDLVIGSGIFATKILAQSLLTATNVNSSFGSVSGTSVSNSTTARAIGLDASGFVLSNSFKSLLSSNGLDPAGVAFVGGLITSIKIGTVSSVPEPSTYALMGIGLVGMSLMARRRRAAND